MTKLSALVLVLSSVTAMAATLSPTVAHAQELDLRPTYAPPAVDFSARAHTRLIKGRVLTGLAIANFAAGIGLGVAGLMEGRQAHCCGANGEAILLNLGSAAATLAGTGLAAGGIPLWVMGAREEKAALSMSAGGLTLRY